MRIEPGIKLDFEDVLIRPKRSLAPSRSAVDLHREFRFLNSGQKYGFFPLIAANMDTTGTIAMARLMHKKGAMCCLHKHYSVSELVTVFIANEARDSTFYTLGIKDEDFEKLGKVIEQIENPPKFICIDAANGYTKYFVDRVVQVREKCPSSVIMAGNVATPSMVQELLISGGADIVKVGIGPGSVCTTRRKTGVGYPQLSAIIECADMAHGSGGHICADGGCREPGDVSKAFGAGADFVMLGGMLAGCAECEGEWIGQHEALKFYGMSSEEAMKKHNGGVSDYKAAEGKCITVPYKGSAADVVKEIAGGLRSACAYVGASKLKDLTKCTTFVCVNRVHCGS